MDRPRTRQLSEKERKELADQADQIGGQGQITWEKSTNMAGEKAAQDREDVLMKRFEDMQDRMSQAATDQSKSGAIAAAQLQEDMLKRLIPQLLQAQPGQGVKTAANNLTATSHTIPSTGIIAAAASGYDHQASTLAHLVGDLSSGTTVDDEGNGNSSS
jgi:hypothetical protein